MKNRFALIDHFAGRDDFLRRYRFMRRWPSRLVDEIMRRVPPLILVPVTEITTPFGRAEGLLLSANLTDAQIARLPQDIILRKIAGACRRAVRLGARVIALGGLAGAAGNDGVNIARRLKVAITTGASFHVAATLEGIRRLMNIAGQNLEEEAVLIIGAENPAGAACARILARDGVNYLALASSGVKSLDSLAARILYESGVSCTVCSPGGRAAKRAELIVVAGEAAAAPFDPAAVRPGTVIFDLLSHRNGLRPAASGGRLVIRSVPVKIPGSRLNLQPELPTGTAFPWMAEAMLLALEGRYESYSLGREMRIGKVDEIGRLAAKHGFEPAGFICAGTGYLGEGELASYLKKRRVLS